MQCLISQPQEQLHLFTPTEVESAPLESTRLEVLSDYTSEEVPNFGVVL
jgi:hypothetical protein